MHRIRSLVFPLFCALLGGCAAPDEPVQSGATPVRDGDDAGPENPNPIDDPDPTPRDGEGDGGDGDFPIDEPTDEKCGVLRATVRDFTPSHPDFESAAFTARNEAEAMMPVTGLVEPMLGEDGRPVFRSTGVPRPQLTGQREFDAWFRDVEGTNQRIEVELELTRTPQGVWVYDNPAFFPIDGMGFGNYVPFANGLHNFHFTTELHVRFRYQPGQRFTFRGDDDLWLFVNGRLAVDLGGLHLPVSGTLDMDAMAETLGVSPGAYVDMDIFHAERHTEQSNFRIETNIECLVVVL